MAGSTKIDKCRNWSGQISQTREDLIETDAPLAAHPSLVGRAGRRI
ncbi:MAG: hypothetical protein AAFY73_13700 [Pseudomonadota bacterium]